ncbi:hypothetical protein AVEN_32601-1 [Araneus ventricosus]|uniref:Uncharacterized protein n=1 Tax=Araneus ventricosus TaxID=182803 RepID=A0A4Y2C9A1_ARAVE|nr:hypothetical protein AVEN_32601-1 [Araneus ventricosus]
MTILTSIPPMCLHRRHVGYSCYFYRFNDTNRLVCNGPYCGYGMTQRVLPLLPQTRFHSADNVISLLSFPNRSIYLLLTMPTTYEKEMERLRKLFAEIETDEDSDFDNEPEDILGENFSDHESFREYDTESEEDGDYGN